MLHPTSWRANPVLVRRIYVAIWLAGLALIWGTYGVARSTIEHNLDHELQRRLLSDTLMLEDHAARSLGSVVSRLQAMVALTGRDDLESGRLAAPKLRDMIDDDAMVRSLSLVDPQGRIVASSSSSNVDLRISPAVAAMIGPATPEPRQGVRFGRTLAQRDLPEAPGPEVAGQSIWLAQADVQRGDLAGYRWLLAINPGSLQNLWTAVAQEIPVQIGLFEFDGTPVLVVGSGPDETSAFTKVLGAALQLRDNGDLVLGGRDGWHLHYRSSSNHPLAFVMLADHRRHVQRQLDRSTGLRWLAGGASLSVSLVVALFFFSYRRYERSLRLNRKLQHDAQTDPLTGLANRRGLEQLAPQQVLNACTMGQSLSLMVIDLDHFKSINDRFGHASGDAVLRAMAERWRRLLRAHDLIARIGGEEFCLLLPGVGPKNASTVARKLLEATRNEPVSLPGEETTLDVTISLGLVSIDQCPAEISLEALVAAADEALYRAKANGRNRVEIGAWPQA